MVDGEGDPLLEVCASCQGAVHADGQRLLGDPPLAQGCHRFKGDGLLLKGIHSHAKGTGAFAMVIIPLHYPAGLYYGLP